MSCLQAAENTETVINAEIAEITEKKTTSGFLCDLCDLCVNPCLWGLLGFNVGHLPRSQRLEKCPRRLEVELLVARFDAEEEAAARGEREPRDAEDRVIRHRQAVEREHAEDGGERSREDRALERHRDERRPAVERTAADVERVRDRRRPVLKEEAAQTAGDPADEHDERKTARRIAERMLELGNRERRVRVHAPVPRVPRALGGVDERRRVGELRHQPVDVPVCRHQSTFASGSIERISKIEIIGRKRTNRNSSARNSPIVPANVEMSHTVGENMPQDEGRKSRWRLVTMITNRSSHMPMLMTIERTKSAAAFSRMRLNQSSCGIATLQRSSSQYDTRYGPVNRLIGTKIS